MDEGIQLEVNTDCELTPNTNLTDVIEHKIFKKKVYIPKRSYKKFVKYSYVALGTIIIILLIIILITRTTFEPKNSTMELKIIADAKNKSSEVLQYFSYELIINDNNNLWGYDPKSEKINLLLKVDNFINAFDIYREKMIFWSEINGLEIFSTASEQSNISNKNLNVAFKETRFNPQALAVDFINEKLYAVDKSIGTLIVIDVRTKQYSILSTSLQNPQDIILDSAEGFLFIMEQSKGICRMNMDGKNYQLIVIADINGITVDRRNQRIYWVEKFLMIMSSNYDGNERTHILEESLNILSLAYFDDHLFWLWSDINQNDTSLRSCTIEKQTCKAQYVHQFTFSNATIIKAFSHSKEIMKDVSNACMRRNGGCQQMCVLTSHKNAGRSCACYSGWELKTDLKSCQPINDQFILHVRKNVIRGFSINRMETKLTNSILPIWFNTESLIYKSSFEITYNTNSDYFYASDDIHIYKVSLKGLRNQTIIYNITGQYYINNIAFDWLTEKLFYIKHSIVSENMHSIMIYDMKRCNASHQTFYSFSYCEECYLDGCPHALIIHPQGEYFFYCVEENNEYYNQNKVSVYQVNINSTNQTIYFKQSLETRSFYLNALAIDTETKYLWWLYETFSYPLYGIKYELKTIRSSAIGRIHLYSRVNMLHIYSNWLYLSTESNIYRVSKSIRHDIHMQDLSPVTIVSLP